MFTKKRLFDKEKVFKRTLYIIFKQYIYLTSSNMTPTFLETNREHKFEKIYSFCQGGNILAECVVFFFEKQIELIHINLVNGTTIEQFITSLLVYAQTHRYRVIEYPLVIMYDDNTFLGDYHHNQDNNHDEGFEYVYNEYDTDDSDIESNEEEAEFNNLRNLKLFQNNKLSISQDISQYVLENFEYTQCVSVNAFKRGVGKCVPNSSIYVTFQVLPDSKTFKAKTTNIQIGCTLSRMDNIPCEFNTAGQAVIYTQKKKINVWSCKENYDSYEDTLNIDFDKSAILVMNTTKRYIDDIYTQFSIGGITLANISDHFRINKWHKYSDIEKYKLCRMTCFDNKSIIYVINSLSFPGGDINDDYVNYTSDVYAKLLPYAKDKKISKSNYISHAILKKENLIEVKQCKRIPKNTKKVAEKEIEVVADKNVTQENTDEITDNTVLNFGYIYLIREREFLHNKQEVYKVGRTVQKGASLLLDRMKAYKKGSELCFMRQVPVENVVLTETLIKTRFNQLFNRHPDGTEYFIGDMNDMIKVINQIIDN